MSVIVYLSSIDGNLSRVEKETLNLAQELASSRGSEAIALCFVTTAEEISSFGVNHAVLVENVSEFDSRQHSRILEQLAKEKNASHVLLPHNSSGKALAGMIAILLEADVASDIIDMDTAGKVFTRNSYSGKARTKIEFNSNAVVLTVSGRGSVERYEEKNVSVELFEEAPESLIEILEVVNQAGEINLEEADLVVSGGRGLKSGDNWGILEDLAEEIGAATACSRPVADSDWRPHHEHVGQTGLSIKPSLYIAAGISGAIQHLAGVNSSKTIVVVNSDPEAPFFKSADYGVCGDLFEVIPKLTEAIRATK